MASVIDTVVNLAKRRGFVFPSGEIYGGTKSAWDYGPLGVPQPLVSQHLKILKAAGVVAGERSGREVLYRLADHHLAHIVVDAVAHAGEDTP